MYVTNASDNKRYNICLRSVSKDFAKDEQTEISLNGTMNDFLGEHSSIKKKKFLVLTNI